MKDILKSFEVWSDAQGIKSKLRVKSIENISLEGIARLRELILELAVRGKLVIQFPTEETGLELLKKIDIEKKQLFESRVIKSIEKTITFKGNNIPYPIPRTWAWTRLIDVYYSISPSGKKLKTSEIQSIGKFPVVDQGKSAIAGYTDNSELLISLPGPVVIFGDHTKEIKYIDFNFVAGADGVKILRPIMLCEKFFYHFLTAYKLEDRGYARHFKGLNENLFAVPPFEEQKRIVAKVNELMALCDELEKQKTNHLKTHQQLVKCLLETLSRSANADELQSAWQRLAPHFDDLFCTEDSIGQLKQTILQLAVMGKLVKQDAKDEGASELLKRIETLKNKLSTSKTIKKEKSHSDIIEEEMPFNLPKSWVWAKCNDICNKITDGEHITPTRSEKGRYLLSARNITNEGVNLSDVDFVPDDEFTRIRKRCDPNIGDILISCSGSVGRVALVDKDNQYVMVRSAAMIRPVPGFFSIKYLAILLRSPYLQTQIRSRSKQSAQANLFLGAIANLVFVIPPLAEQKRIVAKVEELFALCDALKSKLQKAKEIQNTLAETVVGNINEPVSKEEPKVEKSVKGKEALVVQEK